MVRPFAAPDATAVQSLALPAIAELSCSYGARAAVEALVGGKDSDAHGVVALEGEIVIGVVIYGAVAGAVSTGRIQVVVVSPNARRRGLGARLVESAVAALDREGTRVIFVELADEPGLVAGLRLLEFCGFHIDARVADYVGDGIDLAILRRDLPPRAAPRRES